MLNENKLKDNNFKKQMIDLLTSNVVDKLLNAINVFILISWIGLSGFGIWSVLMSILLISDSVVSMGISTYSLEYLIQANSRNKTRNLICYSFLILIIKLIIILFFSSLKNYEFLDPIGGNLVLVNLGFFLSFQEIAKVLHSILQKKNLTNKILYSRLIQSLIRTLLLSSFFIYKLPIVNASLPYLSSTIICCIVSILFLQEDNFIFKSRKSLKKLIYDLFSSNLLTYFPSFINKSLPFALSAMTILLYLKSDILCLEYLSIEKSKIGNYAFSSTLASSIYFYPF